MNRSPGPEMASHDGLLQIEDCLDADGGIRLPAGLTLPSLLDRNVANVGDAVAYRYLDYGGAVDGRLIELTWTEFGRRTQAISARIQDVAARGDRVAILAPQGLDYVAGFFAAVKAGAIAVPLFVPELQGHAERLETALVDARPSAILTTVAAQATIRAFVAKLAIDQPPRIIVVDEIPDSAGESFDPVEIDPDEVSHLQYTSGATRPPVGVEITHRAVGTNLLQMILSIDLLDRNVHGVSWLPLYHDMGLSMIGFPAVYGGHATLLSPTAFIRRPQRWIQALSAGSQYGRVITAAPNFAYEYTVQRGRPGPDDRIDLSNVVMIIGSEPVSIEAITAFDDAFGQHGLPPTAFKPSYGIAEATLFVSTIAPAARPTVVHFDRAALTGDRAVRVDPNSAGAIPQVSCGQVARSQWAVIVDPEGRELGDGQVGEIWLHGNNIGRGYWGRPEETRSTFHASLHTRLPAQSHADGAPVEASWLRTGDLGVYLEGELYVTGRLADLLITGGRHHYPQDVENTTAEASTIVRRGYVAAFTVPGGGTDDVGDQLVVVAERASGARRVDPAAATDAIRMAIERRHGLAVTDVRFVPAGTIPRTTSGKLARVACRDGYRRGEFGGPQFGGPQFDGPQFDGPQFDGPQFDGP